MASNAITQPSALIFLVVLFSTPQAISSTTKPTISASPAILPYVNAPDISSFFPTPGAEGTMSFADPPEAEAAASAPSSGEFVGMKSAGSVRLNDAAAIVGVLLCCFLVTSIAVL